MESGGPRCESCWRVEQRQISSESPPAASHLLSYPWPSRPAAASSPSPNCWLWRDLFTSCGPISLPAAGICCDTSTSLPLPSIPCTHFMLWSQRWLLTGCSVTRSSLQSSTRRCLLLQPTRRFSTQPRQTADSLRFCRVHPPADADWCQRAACALLAGLQPRTSGSASSASATWACTWRTTS